MYRCVLDQGGRMAKRIVWQINSAKIPGIIDDGAVIIVPVFIAQR